MALITRTLEKADGTQQIAIFDTEQQPIGSELGLFISQENKEMIAPANKYTNITEIWKLIFLGLQYN